MIIERALVVVNPEANHGETARLISVAAELLDDCFEHDIVITEGPAHAKQLAYAAEGYDTVIAMGGDGAVHHALNGVMEREPHDRPALAVLPTGSGNDYARTLGMSSELSTAVLQLATGRRRRVDVGTCNGRCYANSLAVGVDAQVTARAVELKVTTGRTGLPLYLSALMYVLFHEYRSYRVHIAFDDGPISERDMLLIAMTHGPTYGGGFHITPDALNDDGLMDVCLIDTIPLYQALWRIPFIIPGRHEWMRPVHPSRNHRVRLESARPIPGQIDGEIIMAAAYDVGVLEGALEVVVPEPPGTPTGIVRPEGAGMPRGSDRDA